MKKNIRFDKRAEKEFKKFPIVTQAKCKALLDILARDGKLVEPYGKKIDTNLFEMRVKDQGAWRLLYAYFIDTYVIVLYAFHKKTQKTPHIALYTAKDRLKGYQL